MNNDILRVQAAALDQVLADWHRWQCQYSEGRGYPGTASGMGQYRVSRQYDDSNGALDAELGASLMRDVDFQVREMPEPHRSAIYVNARNISVKVSVFRHPRLPADQIECLRVIAAARDSLFDRLVKAGVL